MYINLSPRFKRNYKKLPPYLQKDFDKKIILLTKDLYHPLLKTHKLKGKLQACLAFYLRDGYRVLFDFSGPNAIDLLDVGSHNIYQRFKR